MLPPKFKLTYFQIVDEAKYSDFTLKQISSVLQTIVIL